MSASATSKVRCPACGEKKPINPSGGPVRHLVTLGPSVFEWCVGGEPLDLRAAVILTGVL